AQVEANRARVGLVAADNRLRRNWEHLVAVVGVPDLPYRPLADQLEPAGPALEWATALARLLEESPELRVVQAEVVRDQIALQRERVEPIPNVVVRGSTGYNFETRNVTADAQVSIRLPLW